MKTVSTLLAALLIGTSAHAGCTARDGWRGYDKSLHLTLGATIATSVGVHTRSPMTGFWAGAAAGAAKELLDATGSGQCSAQDLVVTLLGAAIGATGAHVIVSPRFIGYRREF